MRSITLVFLFLSSAAFAAFDMNENMRQSYIHIMNLEFDAAVHIMEQEQSMHPNSAHLILQYNYIDFLTILIGEDYDYFKAKEALKLKRIEALKKTNRNSPYYLYAQAEVHLQWAFSRLKFKEYTMAAYEFIKAYKLLEENQKQFPDFILNKKGLGLLHALLGVVPNQYHWILNLAGLSGGTELGLDELNQVLDNASATLYKEEVLFLISFLQIHLTNDRAIVQVYLDRIGESYKESYLLNFAAARLSHNLGKNDYTIRVLENRPDTLGKYPFYYLDYLLGMSYLYQLNYNSAEQQFKYFLKNFKGNNYIKSAYHKLVWIAYLKNNAQDMNSYYKLLITRGAIYIDEDKKAHKDASNRVVSHPLLLKARLHYDGGYYHQAQSELDDNKDSLFFSSTANRVEYWYRLARVEQKLHQDDDKVIISYNQAYKKGLATTMYYAPMSALQIGLIYEKKGDYNQAGIYFQKCLSISGFDYQRGIHQKAKAGLARIEGN